jgi:hypothetical protein
MQSSVHETIRVPGATWAAGGTPPNVYFRSSCFGT